MRTIGILGASGFIGQRLISALRIRSDITIVAASLRAPEEAAEKTRNCEIVVNLAGASVAQRWTPEVKAEIRKSRTSVPQQYLDALAVGRHSIKKYISASAIGYYGTSEEAIFTEASPAGRDMLASVCVDWERTTRRAGEMLGVPTATIRTGLVLGHGGALAQILPIFKLGLGGKIGHGRQWYSWIHIDDVVGIYMHAIEGAEGVFNAVAPEPVRNQEFTHALGIAVRRPTFFPVPALAITAMLGEGAVVVVEGQRVKPEATLASGYRFSYNEVEPALRAIVGS